MATKLDIKRELFAAYDGFADKRYKRIENDAPFIVDDRTSGDYDTRNQLFLWFCQMFVFVEEHNQLRFSLRGGIPKGAGVAQWYADHNAEQGPGGIEIIITPENLDDILDLADRFSDVIRHRYDTPAYKYVVPRVSGSLRKLHSVLSPSWK